MAYIVIKTIKGRQYQYQQRSYRQGGKVRTETIYLGPVDGGSRRKGVLRRIGEFIEVNRTPKHGLPDDETVLRQYNEKVERDRLAREKVLDELHSLYGLRMSGPSQVPASSSARAPSQPSTAEAGASGGAASGADAPDGMSNYQLSL
jgi:hypothetical protein